MSLRISTLVVAALGAGCATGDLDPAAGDPATGDVQQAFNQCPEFMCGTNSPVIANLGFWELNLPPAAGVAGLPNNVGLQVLDFMQGVQSYQPKVIGGRLIATSSSTTLTGAQLVNGWLRLRLGRRQFRLQVTEVSTVDSWALPTSGVPVALETYKLDWTELINGLPGRYLNVCHNIPSRESSEILTMTGLNIYRTLVFEGDRIDARKKLDTGVDPSWFNLGCAGSALAKMALTGHTEASHVTRAFDTTLAERQTMLKMLAADYCGDGTAFTVAGQPLNWRDDHGTMKLTALMFNPPQPLILESRWNEKGAVCLDKPRVDAHWTQLGDTTFGPDVYDQVAAWCPQAMPPPCTDSSFETGGYHLLTATVPYHP
jgi:hypothetical protein